MLVATAAIANGGYIVNPKIVNKIGDIKHPLIKGCLRKMKIWGLDINSVADIPA